MLQQAEYLWLDGAQPTRVLRSKTRIVDAAGELTLSNLPEWSFDGSSTDQATGHDSDITLKPVNMVRDPIRGNGSYLVMCETFLPNGMTHPTNTRARLREVLAHVGDEDPWVGIEQEYALYQDGRLLGWPENGYPAPQGPYYCGVGAGKVTGRNLIEEHTRACIEAGVMIYGVNAEVLLGQWEFQIGYRGVAGEKADPLNVADHLWFARYLMHRLGEEHGIEARFDAKPVKGDWNGSGAHTNFSTRKMRSAGGLQAIHAAIRRLEKNHSRHVAVYGHGLAERLTGRHETCSIDEFRGGVADRGASIRIPRHVEELGYGYLEDRRPAANADPYEVCAVLTETICLDHRNVVEVAA
jgi:glutamine synthetase